MATGFGFEVANSPVLVEKVPGLEDFKKDVAVIFQGLSESSGIQFQVLDHHIDNLAERGTRVELAGGPKKIMVLINYLGMVKDGSVVKYLETQVIPVIKENNPDIIVIHGGHVEDFGHLGKAVNATLQRLLLADLDAPKPKIIFADKGWDTRGQIVNLNSRLGHEGVPIAGSTFGIVADKIHAQVKKLQYYFLLKTDWDNTSSIPTSAGLSKGHVLWNMFEVVGIFAPKSVDKVKRAIQAKRGLVVKDNE